MGLGDWWNENIMGSKNSTKVETVPIQEEAYEYGGRFGGADEAANRYRKQAEQAQGREAAQANYSAAIHAGLNPGMQARGDMNRVGQAQLARALGRVPSIAQMQADRQMGQATAAQASAAASARGPAAMALAQQNAANNTANVHGAISNQAQINAAQERMAAEGAAANTFGNMGALDAQRMKQLADMSQYQATNQMQQRELNDRYDIAKSGMEMGVRGMEMTGAQNREAQYSNNYYNAKSIEAGIAGQNSSMAQQTGGALINMGGQAAATYASGGSVTGKADGGPVKAEQPYLVGERGPELIVPKRDAVVIPAPQTNALLSRAMGKPEVIDLDAVDIDNDPGAQDFDADEYLESKFPKPYDRREFKRDTPADQAAVKRAVQDQASREADAMMAGYMAALKQGPAVAARDAETPDLRLAARADGGPLGKGQPAMVGERGPEMVVPSTWGTGGASPDAQLAYDQRGKQAEQAQAASARADAWVDPYQRDVDRVRNLRAVAPGLVDEEDRRAERVGKVRMRKQAAGVKDRPEEDDAEERMAVSEGKKAPPSLRSRLGSAIGSVADGADRIARTTDTSYRGPSSIAGPNLIPVMAPPRAMGGPVAGGQPYTVGEQGPEMILPMPGMGGGKAMSPMSGAASPSFDKLSGGGMDVLGSLKAHSNVATKFQRDPSGGMVAREEGGPVAQGQTALVGEKGPEMVVPQPSLLSRIGDSLRSVVGLAPATTEAPPAPRTPRYAEISSGAPLTTGTGERPEVTTPMAGHVRIGNGTTYVLDSHGYADEKAPRETRGQELERHTLAQRANIQEDANDEHIRRKRAEEARKAKK